MIDRRAIHHDRCCRKLRGASRFRGFTLLEMLVAIGIIVALAAITVAAGLALQARAKETQTENTMKVLDLALQEWERASDRKLSWGTDGVPYATSTYEMQNGKPHIYTLTEVLRIIDRQREVRSILAAIEPDLFYVYDTALPGPSWITYEEPAGAGNPQPIYSSNNFDGAGLPLTGLTAVLDAWGNPIRAVHPGRVADVGAFGAATDDATDPSLVNPDGTVYVDATFYATESMYGIAKDRRMLFVSAGPDGLFGDRSMAAGTPAHQYTLDNVFSYEPEQP